MLRLKATLLALVCTAIPTYTTAEQLPFIQAPHSEPDQLVRLSWPSRSAAEEAVAWLDDNEFDVWSTTPQHTTLRLSPSQHEQLASSPVSPSGLDILLPSISDHLGSTTLTTPFNLQHSEAAVVNLSRTRLRALDDPIHDSYHPLDALNQILRRFEEEFPGYARVVQVGQSAEGKEILGIKGASRASPVVGRFDSSRGCFSTQLTQTNLQSPIRATRPRHQPRRRMQEAPTSRTRTAFMRSSTRSTRFIRSSDSW